MTISYARHQYPPPVIQHAVWLYLRFTLSFRDVEDLLAERGLDISYESVRRWVTKFGPQFVRELRNRRPRPTLRWHLDEMVVSIAGRHFWLWRAVDDEGEVLDLLVQRRRDKTAAGIVMSDRACGTSGGSLAKAMQKISYDGYRFPPVIIQQAIWLYLRFTLSLRDVEDLLAERGIAVSYETIRRWVNHFGPMIAADLRKRRPKPCTTWYLDEVYLKIAGRMVYLWRAVDAEGEVVDVLVQSRRDKHAGLKLMRKLLKKYGFVPDQMITDDLRSYGAAVHDLGIERHH